MFRNTQSILGAFIVIIATWALTMNTRNKIIESIEQEKERFPATEIHYTGMIRSIPYLVVLTIFNHVLVDLLTTWIGNIFRVNLFIWASYGMECMKSLRKSVLKQLGYTKKEIKDIFKQEEEEEAMKKYEEEHGGSDQKKMGESN